MFNFQVSYLMNKKVFYESISDIGVLTIDNPPVNCLSIDLIDSLNSAIDQISSSTKILIFKSKGRGFCAGADLKERSKMNDDDTIKTVEKYNYLFNKINSLSIPTICAIHGYALGGGLELALSCDFRFATIKSKLGFPETSIGIIPGAGGTQRMTLLVGESISKKWIFTADKFNASEALNDKVIDRVFENKKLMDEYIIDFSSKIKNNSKLAISLAKKAISYSLISTINEGLDFERKQYLKTLSNPDRIKFLDKMRDKK